jgi:DMSO reductase anchor subunit
VNLTHVRPEHPHWSLVLMTVLTQLSVGALVVVWLLQMTGESHLGNTAITALAVGALALGGATFHLGRPAYAYRAVRMWRRSWLSREVLLFGAFSGVAAVYAALLWFSIPGGTVAGALTSLIGMAAVTASACIYRVPSRPAWNSPLTVLQFHLTAAALGPLLALAAGASAARWPAYAAAAMASSQLVLVAVRFVGLIAADSIELRGTARLLSTTLRVPFLARGVLLAVGGVLLPLVANGVLMWAALCLALAGELLGRYLFFVSVVPKHMATPYLEAGSEAA